MLVVNLEKEMATHSSVLAWRIPGTGEPGGLSSLGSHRVGHDRSDLAAAAVVNHSYLPIKPKSVGLLWQHFKLFHVLQCNKTYFSLKN